MAQYPPLFPAPSWNGPTSKRCVLFHGCTKKDADSIVSNGIQLSSCRLNTDFGHGFYLTTSERQARQWAWYRFYGNAPRARAGNPAEILTFDLAREDLAGLETLVFVRNSFDYDDYWSIVHHFRYGNQPNNHCRPPGSPAWFDAVWGPVSVLWPQRNAMSDADQVSFHTPAAIRILTRAINAGTVTRAIIT